MKVALTLQAEQFVVIYNVLLVEDIGSTELLLFMVEVYEGCGALGHLRNILEQLSHRAIDPYRNIHYLALLSLQRVQPQSDSHASFQVAWVNHDVLEGG